MAAPFDGQYETFQHYGTNAARLAFTPNPSTAAGVQPIYIWYETDTGNSYLYDTSWHALVAGGGATLPATVQGDMLYASGTNTIAALAKNASATRYLSNTGATNNPAWSQVVLTNGVSGILPVANGGTGVSAAFSPVLLASGTISNANFKNLPTVPVVAVAAPGAGFRIKVISGTFQSDFSAGAYTGASTTFSALNFRTGTVGAWVSTPIVNDNGGSPVLTKLTDFLGTTVALQEVIGYQESSAGYVIPAPVASTATANYDNLPIEVGIDNGGVNLGGGNAGNVFKWRLWYVVEAL